MNKKTNFMFHLRSEDFKEIQFNGDYVNLIKVYILCKFSFKNNPNLDINKLVSNYLSSNEINYILSNGIRTDFSFNDIMYLKNNKIDFYIVDESRLSTIFNNKGIKNKFNSNIFYGKSKGINMLHFLKEGKCIEFNIRNNPPIVFNNNYIKNQKLKNKSQGK